MTHNAPIRILLVDDHPVVRSGLAAIINRRADMEVIAEAKTGRSAITCYQELQPDVVLMGIHMPEMNGIEALNIILDEDPSGRIILLATYDGDEAIYHGLQAGAKAYVLKEGSRRELINTIRDVHAGRRHIPPLMAARLAEHARESALTDQELEVLALIAAGKSDEEIRQALKESDVETHVNNLLSKLGVSDRTHAVTTALRRGIIQPE